MEQALSIPIEEAASFLFVPGDRPERFAKAFASGAHAVILDLEDAVRPEAKDKAREATYAAFDSTPLPVTVLVRINAAGSPFHADDLALCRRVPAAALVLPKAESACVVEAVHTATGKPVLPLVETAKGLEAASCIAGAPAALRLVLGTIDLAHDLRIKLGSPSGEHVLDAARFGVLVASAAAGKAAPVDGVYTAIKDLEGLADAARRSRDGGFSGMLCIHPSQATPVNAAFAPSPAEVTWAVKVLAAAAGQPGAFQFEGEMIDAPVLLRATRISRQARR